MKWYKYEKYTKERLMKRMFSNKIRSYIYIFLFLAIFIMSFLNIDILDRSLFIASIMFAFFMMYVSFDSINENILINIILEIRDLKRRR